MSLRRRETFLATVVNLVQPGVHVTGNMRFICKKLSMPRASIVWFSQWLKLLYNQNVTSWLELFKLSLIKSCNQNSALAATSLAPSFTVSRARAADIAIKAIFAGDPLLARNSMWWWGWAPNFTVAGTSAADLAKETIFACHPFLTSSTRLNTRFNTKIHKIHWGILLRHIGVFSTWSCNWLLNWCCHCTTKVLDIFACSHAHQRSKHWGKEGHGNSGLQVVYRNHTAKIEPNLHCHAHHALTTLLAPCNLPKKNNNPHGFRRTSF